MPEQHKAAADQLHSCGQDGALQAEVLQLRAEVAALRAERVGMADGQVRCKALLLSKETVPLSLQQVRHLQRARHRPHSVHTVDLPDACRCNRCIRFSLGFHRSRTGPPGACDGAHQIYCG